LILASTPALVAAGAARAVCALAGRVIDRRLARLAAATVAALPNFLMLV
jgi:hypothetical protein